MQHDFGAAKGVLGLVEALGWFAVFGGIVIGVIMFLDGEAIQGLAIAVIPALSGLVLIVGAQMGRAQIATAENTAQVVELLRKGAQPAQGGPTLTRPAGLIKQHKGRAISRNEMGEVHVDGKVFSNVLAAERAIDNGQI